MPDIFDEWYAEIAPPAAPSTPARSTFDDWWGSPAEPAVEPVPQKITDADLDQWAAEVEPSFMDNLAAAPVEALKGWVRGANSIPESAGAAMEYAGRRLETTPEEQIQNGINRLNPNQQGEIINKMIDWSRPGVDEDASFNRAAKQTIEKYAPISALRGAAMDAGNAIAPHLIDAGRATSDYYKDMASGYKADASFENKNLWDNPDLLLNPAWWSSSTAEMMPQLIATLIPAAGIQSAVTRVGASLIPQTVEASARLVKLGRFIGAAGGGAAGGGMEATQTYRDVLETTGNEKEAARAAEFMGVASSILNTVGNAEILEYAGKSFLKKVGRGFVVEGASEGLEEPADVSGRMLSKIINGEDLPDDVANLYLDSLKSALTVFPIAGVTGAAGAAGTHFKSKGAAVNLLESKAADTDLAAQLRATVADAPVGDGTIPLDTPAPPGGFGFPVQDQAEMDAMEQDIIRQRQTALAGPEIQATPLQVQNQAKIDRYAADQAAAEQDQIRQAQQAQGLGKTGEVLGQGVDQARQTQELLYRAGGLPVPEQTPNRLALPFPDSIDPNAIPLPYDDTTYDSIFDQWEAEEEMEAPTGARTAIPMDKRQVGFETVGESYPYSSGDSTPVTERPNMALLAGPPVPDSKVAPVGMSAPESPKPETKKEKSRREYNEFVSGLSEQQLEKVKGLIPDTEPDLPGSVLLKIKAKLKADPPGAEAVTEPVMADSINQPSNKDVEESWDVGVAAPVVGVEASSKVEPPKATRFPQSHVDDLYAKNIIHPVADAQQSTEIETDPARVQEIKNSIAEGEIILKSGKTISGKRMLPEQLAAVQRAVDSSYLKIGGKAPQKTTEGGDANVQTEGQGQTQALPKIKSGPQEVTDPTTPPAESIPGGGSKNIVKGKQGTAYTQKNDPVGFHYAVVDADDLVVSHDAEFHKNEAYPQELQPRDRDRSALRLQVEKIANTINPARLGQSAGVSSGAPIVGPDMVVESGNGRSIALRKAFALGKGEAYRKFLADNAEDFGVNPDEIGSIKNPVLVRVRADSKMDRANFAKEANRDEIARMSPLEQAISDAELITDDDISMFKPSDDGAISPHANSAFVKRFFTKMGGNESAGLMTDDGRITKTGLDRLQAAVFAKAYADKNIVELQAEEAHPDIKTIINALNIAAGEFAKARSNGDAFNALDITSDIVEAAKIVRRSRNEKTTVSQIVNQKDMFSKRSVESEVLAQFFDNNIRRGKHMGTALKKMAETIKNDLQNRNQLDMFGKKLKITKQDAITRGIEYADAERDNGQRQKGLFDSSFDEGNRGDQQGKLERSSSGNPERVVDGGVNERSNSYQTVLEKPTQLSFDFKPSKREGNKTGAVLPVSNPARVRMSTTGDIHAAGTVVRDSADAAALLAHIRKAAQENLYFVTTDKDGLVLEIHRYSKGEKASAAFNSIEATGGILRIPRAAHTYMVHNHPSGTLFRSNLLEDSSGASDQDVLALKRLSSNLGLKGISAHGLIIEGTTYTDFTPGSDYERKPIRATIRKVKLPVKERIFKYSAQPSGQQEMLNSPEKVAEVIKNKYGDKDGLMFLNTGLFDVGFMPWPKGENQRVAVAKIISEAEQLNARGFVVNLSEISPERMQFIKDVAAGTRLELFDVIESGDSFYRKDTWRLSGSAVSSEEASIDRLNSIEDRPLYSTSPLSPQSGITLKDVRDMFPGMAVTDSGYGKFTLTNPAGKAITVETVSRIGIDDGAFEISYQRKPTSEEKARGAAGSYQNGTIKISKSGDRWSLAHEAYHHLEASGMISAGDILVLNEAVKKAGGRATEEARARFVEDMRYKRDSVSGRLRKLLHKIRDLIDGFVNLFRRTAKGVIRDIESGSISKGEISNSQMTAAAPAYQIKTDFSKQLDDFISRGETGQRNYGELITVGWTPDVLLALGAKKYPVTMSPKVAIKILNDREDRRGIPVETLKQIPEAIADPIMVFDSKTAPKGQSLVVVTELKSPENKTIIVAIYLNQRNKRHEVNAIGSLYGKDKDPWFVDQIKEGRLRYINKKKSNRWSQSAGLQLPLEETTNGSSNRKILFDHDIVKPKTQYSGTNPRTNNDPFAEENRRLREQDKTLWEKAGKVLKRQLAPGGLLPDEVFSEKIKRDSEFNVVEMDTERLVVAFERAVKKDYGKTFQGLPFAKQKELADALAGKVPANMPEGTKTTIVAMRRYIDGLSLDYADILFKQAEQIARDGKNDAAAAAKVDLLNTIAGNVGQYVHRSYRVFDDKNWFKKVPTEIINDARLALRDQYMEKGETQKDADTMADRAINKILKTGTAFDSMESFIKESKLGAKDLSVLKRRKDISPEIRALLGQHIDPRVNFAKTATKMGRLVWNQRFLDKIRETGMGVFLFEDENAPAGATKQIAADQSETYSPLNGLWTFPEIDQAFKDALGKEQMPDWLRTIVQVNGAIKFGKTVLSPTTAARNWQSAMFFALANGHFNMTHMAKSITSLQEYFNANGSDAKFQYLRKLKQLGVVYDSPYAGEMMRLLADSQMADDLIRGTGHRTLKNMIGYAQKFYQFGDDFWKIIGFENEKTAFMRTGMDEAEAEKEAAERIRNTYPTYSMVGKAIKSLARFPLVGTFVSFPAEIIRTQANMLSYVAQDFKTPGRKKMALRRMAGMAISAGAIYALQAVSKVILSVDDEEDEATRKLAAPWQRNSNLWYLNREKDGSLRYIDLSFLAHTDTGSGR